MCPRTLVSVEQGNLIALICDTAATTTKQRLFAWGRNHIISEKVGRCVIVNDSTTFKISQFLQTFSLVVG